MNRGCSKNAKVLWGMFRSPLHNDDNGLQKHTAICNILWTEQHAAAAAVEREHVYKGKNEASQSRNRIGQQRVAKYSNFSTPS